jgi:hypothetical protein
MRLAAMAGRHQQPGTEDMPIQVVFLLNTLSIDTKLMF